MNDNIHLHLYGKASEVREDMPANEIHVWYLDFDRHYQSILQEKTVASVALHGMTEQSFGARFPELVQAIHTAAGSNVLAWTEFNTREDNTMTDDQITEVETHNPTLTIEESPAPLAPPPVAIPVEDDIDRMTVKQMVRHCTMMFRELTVSLANYASNHDADLAEIRVAQQAQAEALERLLVATSAKDERLLHVLDRSLVVSGQLNDSVTKTLTSLDGLGENVTEVLGSVNAGRLELAEHTGTTRGQLGAVNKALETTQTPVKNESGWTYVLFLALGLVIGAAIIFAIRG